MTEWHRLILRYHRHHRKGVPLRPDAVIHWPHRLVTALDFLDRETDAAESKDQHRALNHALAGLLNGKR